MCIYKLLCMIIYLNAIIYIYIHIYIYTYNNISSGAAAGAGHVRQPGEQDQPGAGVITVVMVPNNMLQNRRK